MKKKKESKYHPSGYTLPDSGEKGESFIDFNAVLKKIIPKKVKIVRKKKVIILEKRKDE